MTPYKRRLNPYIRRMAEDMQLRVPSKVNCSDPPMTSAKRVENGSKS